MYPNFLGLEENSRTLFSFFFFFFSVTVGWTRKKIWGGREGSKGWERKIEVILACTKEHMQSL